MRWCIEGVDRESSASRRFWVDALTRDDAISQAADLGIIVESAAEDHPVAAPTTVRVQLTKQQLKALRVGQLRIAGGVFWGLLFWSIFCALCAFLALVLGAGAIVSQA